MLTTRPPFFVKIIYSSSFKNPCSKAPGNWNILSMPLKVTTIRPPSMPFTWPELKALWVTMVPAWILEVSRVVLGLTVVGVTDGFGGI